MTELLVIGYGNELRGDDGVGPRVARAVAGWHRPGVRALAVQQLTPELADELADVERVVFVDAAADAEGVVCWRHVHPAGEPARLGHTGDPGWLLGLVDALNGRSPRAWMATIPARELGYGEYLSPAAERGVAVVLHRIADLVRHTQPDLESAVNA
jgi:hydrogenase maturation protease